MLSVLVEEPEDDQDESLDKSKTLTNSDELQQRQASNKTTLKEIEVEEVIVRESELVGDSF